VAAAGLILLIVGFVLIVPSGGIAGSSAHRNIRMGPTHLSTTPGYDDEDDPRRTRRRIIAGLVTLAAAGVCLAIGL